MLYTPDQIYIIGCCIPLMTFIKAVVNPDNFDKVIHPL